MRKFNGEIVVYPQNLSEMEELIKFYNERKKEGSSSLSLDVYKYPKCAIRLRMRGGVLSFSGHCEYTWYEKEMPDLKIITLREFLD